MGAYRFIIRQKNGIVKVQSGIESRIFTEIIHRWNLVFHLSPKISCKIITRKPLHHTAAFGSGLIVICSLIGIAPVQFPGQILAGTASVAEFLFITGGTGARLTGFTVITCFTVERKRAFGCIAHKYHPPYTLLPTPPITASENNTGNSPFKAKNPISNIPVMYQAYEQQFLYFHYTLTKGEYK